MKDFLQKLMEALVTKGFSLQQLDAIKSMLEFLKNPDVADVLRTMILPEPNSLTNLIETQRQLMDEMKTKQIESDDEIRRITEDHKVDLADLRILVKNISRTYDHFSAGAVSKPMTNPEEVFKIARKNRLRDCEEERKDPPFIPDPNAKRIEKKCWPVPFQQMSIGAKTAEVRLDDWECKTGDVLVLKEWDPSTENYTGEILTFNVTDVLKTSLMPYFSKEKVQEYGFQVLSLERFHEN